jgi:hypothetical protein
MRWKAGSGGVSRMPYRRSAVNRSVSASRSDYAQVGQNLSYSISREGDRNAISTSNEGMQLLWM